MERLQRVLLASADLHTLVIGLASLPLRTVGLDCPAVCRLRGITISFLSRRGWVISSTSEQVSGLRRIDCPGAVIRLRHCAFRVQYIDIARGKTPGAPAVNTVKLCREIFGPTRPHREIPSDFAGSKLGYERAGY